MALTAKPGPAAHRRTLDKGAREYQNYIDDVRAGAKAFTEGVSRDACPHPKSWVKRRRIWTDSWDRTKECGVHVDQPTYTHATVPTVTETALKASYATLPMITYTTEANPNGGHRIELRVAHLIFNTGTSSNLLPEAKRDLDNLKNAVAAAAKISKILAETEPQTCGDGYVTVEFEIKRTDLAEIEKLLKVNRGKPEKLYPLGDTPTEEETGIASFSERYKQQNIHAVATGEYRAPKKGEWYLSGAKVVAYRASNDLLTIFQIAKLVKEPR